MPWGFVPGWGYARRGPPPTQSLQARTSRFSEDGGRREMEDADGPRLWGVWLSGAMDIPVAGDWDGHMGKRSSVWKHGTAPRSATPNRAQQMDLRESRASAWHARAVGLRWCVGRVLCRNLHTHYVERCATNALAINGITPRPHTCNRPPAV